MIGEAPHFAENLLHAAHTAVLMREHGIRRIYTRDTDFHRFRFVEPVVPLGLELKESRPRGNTKRPRRGRD